MSQRPKPKQTRYPRLLLSLCALLALSKVAPVLAQQAEPVSEEQYKDQPNLVAKAASLGNFKTLLLAADSADLLKTLSEDGPYTLFAPSDEAFRKLPDDLLDRLLRDKKMLRRVLLYHVVAGRRHAREVLDSDNFDTLAETSLGRRTLAGLPFVDTSRIIRTDIDARNGVIHVIDKVLLPPVDFSSNW